MEKNNKAGFTDKQKQEFKKYMVYGLLFILFLGVMWFIFKPTAEEEAEANVGVGLNTEIPAPGKVELTTNKKSAYEQNYLKEKQEEKVKTLNNFALLAGLDSTHKNSELKLDIDPVEEKKVSLIPDEQSKKTTSLNSIRGSVDTYKKTNETLSNFYSSPSASEAEETKKLKEEIERLKEQIQGKKLETDRLQEQTALMERSYQLAAKYFPGAGQTVSPPDSDPVSKEVKISKDKESTVAVRELSDNVVSALPQHLSYQDILEMFSQERAFLYASEDASGSTVKRAIQVCIDQNQVITNGQNINMRLLVPIQVGGNIIIPKNSLITGQAGIQGERLQITVSYIEYENMIISVDLKAYSYDGQPGIFVRDIQEVNAAKEIAGNIGGNLGTSISLTQNAGQQLASDLGKSLIQGTSQYLQKKVRLAKIPLKAGFPLLLVSNKN